MAIKKQNYNLIFMGTPDFATEILSYLLKNKWNVKAVFCQPDKKVGRKQEIVFSPTKKEAIKHNIPVHQPETLKDKIVIEEIKSLKPDLIVVAAYGQIIPKEILEIPKYGSINVHASLLPKYRGASPIQAAILAGEKETGITVMLMDEKMDHGPILAQKKIKIYNNETGESLHDRLAKLGSKVLAETLPKWLEGKIKLKPQNHSKATYTEILKRGDGKIDWKKSQEEIERQIRAFWPWPSSWTIWDKRRLKIVKAKPGTKKIEKKYKPGRVFLTQNKGLAVACGKKYLIVEKLQLEGKKEMSAKEFLRGYSKIVGAILK